MNTYHPPIGISLSYQQKVGCEELYYILPNSSIVHSKIPLLVTTIHKSKLQVRVRILAKIQWISVLAITLVDGCMVTSVFIRMKFMQLFWFQSNLLWFSVLPASPQFWLKTAGRALLQVHSHLTLLVLFTFESESHINNLSEEKNEMATEHQHLPWLMMVVVGSS